MWGHVSVMLDEVLSLFENKEVERFCDGTLGAGGHAEALLEAHPEMHLVGIDRDPLARRTAGERLSRFSDRVEIVAGNFRDVEGEFDGILLDVGLSSLQLADEGRGFSFAADAPLDMRMDPSQRGTAAEILNKWSEPKLAELFFKWGEMRGSRAAARAIVQGRPFRRTGELAKALETVLPRGKRHPLTQLFQALRIAVNDELGALEQAIPRAYSALRPGGRLAIISFHSLEDRIVKHAFKGLGGSILTAKPLTPTLEEIRTNRRARSAKLRCIEKCPVHSFSDC
jgi:16S rRNA (cytosine1402-N4)-methyltransferase